MKPLRESLALRRYSMLIQLLNNNFTMKIVLSDIEHDFYTLITASGYANRGNESLLEKRNKIISGCLNSIKMIRKNDEDESAFNEAVKYLLRHNTKDNHELLSLLST